MADMIKLKNGTEVTAEEFYSWSANKQHGSLVGLNEAAKAKIRAARLGQNISDQTRAKMSAAQSARIRPPMSDAAKAKLSASLKGRRHSKESIAKMVASRTGLKRPPQSPEAKAKVQATWAAKRAAKAAHD